MAARGPFTRHPPLQVPVSRMLRSRRHRPQGTPKAASEWSHAAWPQRTLHLRPSDRLDLGTQDARPPPQPRTSRQGEGGRPPSAGRRHWLWGSRVRGGAPSWQTWPISIGSFHQRAVVLAWMATQGWPHRNRTAHCPQRPPCWAPVPPALPQPHPPGDAGPAPHSTNGFERFSAFPKPHSQDRRHGRSPIGLTAGLAFLKLCPAAGRLQTGHHGPLSLSFLSCPRAPRMAGQ